MKKSVINSNKGTVKRRNKGFSLAEMLVVIAIIAILLGLSLIGINRYRRSLKLVETDGLAKEIYVAAQNNLTMAYSQGYLGISQFGTPDENDDVKGKEVYYYIVPSDYNYKPAGLAGSALDLMLPAGSIDPTALKQGNIIIRYQKSTGTVLDVFYAPAPGFSFSHEFTADADYQKLIYNESGNYRTEEELRKNYGKAVIGYCGNYDGPGKSVEGYDLMAPTVRGVNSNVLYAVITFPEVDGEKYNVEKTVTVTGENGKQVVFVIDDFNKIVTRIDPEGRSTSFNIESENSPLRKVSAEDGQKMPGDVVVPKDAYILVIDDITTKNMHFTDLYPKTEGWTPGEDVTVQSEIKLSDKENSSVTHSAESNKVTMNSLFGSNNNGDISVNNIRQLENLDPDISDFTPDKPIKVDQNSNITFDEFLEELGSDSEITKKNGGDDPSAPGTFAPVDVPYPIEYDGHGHSIEDIKVNTDGDAGIFGEIKGGGSKITDLIVINPDIYTEDGNAGALVATVKGGSSSRITISGVIAYNARPMDAAADWNDSGLKIHAGWNAGGLIGAAEYTDVKSSGAALYVESAPKNAADMMANLKDETSSKAGGFIGYAKSSSFTACFAGGHTSSGRYLSSMSGVGRVNVVGSFCSGGFAGMLDGVDVEASYTTCSAGSKATAYTASGENKTLNSTVGGFAATIKGGSSVNYSYTVGRVTGDNYAADFYFDEGSTPFTGENNYFLEDVSINNKSQTADGRFTSIKIASNNHALISYEASRNIAVCYDHVVTVDSEGKYYFLTVDQLCDKARVAGMHADGITDTQYGDWQLPSFSTSSIFFVNGDKLELNIQLDAILNDNDTYLSIGIAGETSGKTRTFLFDLKNAKAGEGIESTHGYVKNGDIEWVSGSKSDTLKAAVDPTGTYLVITLDDITTADGHFAGLFCVPDAALGAGAADVVLIPGENITAYAVPGLAGSESQMAASSSDKTNSLFDYGDTKQSGIVKEGTPEKETVYMYVSNVRHLQNASSEISGVSSSARSKIILSDDIKWAAPFSNGIYSCDGKKAYIGFRGIVLDNLVLFDGQGHVLENFEFATVIEEANDTVYYDSALIQYIYGDGTGNETVEFRDFIIRNPISTVISSGAPSTKTVSANATALIARVGGQVNLYITGVSVMDYSDDAATGYAISAEGRKSDSAQKTAGGLIARASVTPASIIRINNSSVSATVRAYTQDGVDSGCAAGGFIGRLDDGKLSVTDSYVGGHTIAGKYDTTVYNIYGCYAGGFVGYAATASDGSVNVTNSFTTASVKGNVSGSWFGTVRTPVVLENVYTIAPVFGAADADSERSDAKLNRYAAALIGTVEGAKGSVRIEKKAIDSGEVYTAYYLPECYEEKSLSSSMLVREGFEKITGEIQPMYYDSDSGRITTSDVQKEVTVKKGGFVILTHPYDVYLQTSGKEFPFNCWTVSADASEGGLKSFTGDWVIEGIAPAETHEVTFYYINLNSKNEYSILKTPANNLKRFISGSDAEILVPSMDSLNNGYTAYQWFVGDKINPSEFDLNAWAKNSINYNNATGMVTVPYRYTEKDLSVVVIYKQNANTYTADFMYDKTGRNDYSQSNAANIIQIGNPQIVTALNKVIVPNCHVNKADTPNNKDMTFIGWFSDPECTKPIDFSSSAALNASVTAYAKFGYKYTVTIEYFYRDGNDLRELVAKTRKNYLSSDDALPKIPLLEGASDVFLGAYELLYVKTGNATTGTDVATIPTGFTYSIQTTAADDITYYAVYRAKSDDFNLDYSVEYVFAHTASDWSYSDTASKTVNAGSYHATNTADLIMVGSGASRKTFSEYFNDMTEAGDKKCTDGFIITGYTLPTAAIPKLTISVARREFSLSADANTGAYTEPVEIEYGRPIYSIIGDMSVERKGYTLPTTFEQKWEYYKLGGNSATAKPLTKTTPMPDNDTVINANWIAGTSNYTVIFWYENANDVRYSYGGSVTRQGTTGSQISTDTWKTYNDLQAGGTAHVHSITCFPGTTSTRFVEHTETTGTGCDRETETYWTVNGRKTDFDPDDHTGDTDGTVRSWRYDGEAVSNKCIKVGREWYVYNGTYSAGQKAACEGQTTAWLTSELKTQFTYSQDKSYLESSDKAGHETIDGDGSTILNVYFSRNRYHFYIKLSGQNYSHTHTDITGECYELSCGKTPHTHGDECLSCTIEEHTHGDGKCTIACGITEHLHNNTTDAVKCDYTDCPFYGLEHVHDGTNCDYSSCTITVHTHNDGTCTCPKEVHVAHVDSCYHHHNASCQNPICDHKNGHLISCYYTSSQYTVSGSLTGDSKTAYDALVLNVTSPKSGYIYKEYASAGICGSRTAYFFYLNGSWYYLDSKGTYSDGTQVYNGKIDDYNGNITESKNMVATSCSHGDQHVSKCFSCNCVEGQLTCTKEVHVHTSNCCTKTVHTHNADCCKIVEHTHDENCCSIDYHKHSYENCCDVPLHTHTEENGCYGNCNAEKHEHTAACYTLVCKKEEYAAGTSRNPNNYLAVLYAKYQSNISKEWEEYVNKLGEYYWWSDKTGRNSSKYSDYFKHYIYSVDIMPGQDLYFEDYSSGTSSATVNYYVEAIPGKVTDKKLTRNGVDMYFDLYTTGKPKTGGWSFTYEEEFYNILGFKQYAYRHGTTGNANYSPTTLQGDSISGTIELFYTRDSFNLDFYVDNLKTKTVSVKSDEVLDNYLKSAEARPSYAPSDYEFSGWFLDQECTEPYVAGSTMPISNYILYSRWLPPVKTVTFMLSETDTSAYRTAQTRKYSTLEGIITNKSTNEYKSAYHPEGLAFWYYRENGVKKRFIPQKQINEDMTLYAEFTGDLNTSKITVKYRLRGTDTLIGNQSAEYTFSTGSLFVTTPATITGYSIVGWRAGEDGELHLDTNASITVLEEAAQNVIIFEYDREITWKYVVEYYMLFKSQYTGTVPGGIKLSNKPFSFKIESLGFDETMSSSETRIIECKLPYDNYALDHIEVDGVASEAGRAYEYLAYDGSDVRTVAFYITPDSASCGVNDLHFDYDGTDKLRDLQTDPFEIKPEITAPAGYTASVNYYYSFMDGDKTLTSAVHAGSYKVNVYGVVTLTNGTDTFNYLLWKAEDSSVRLIIDPKIIRLRSGTSETFYSPSSVLTNKEIYGLVKNGDAYDQVDWKTVFCGSDADYFEPVFVIDAFRLDVGTSENAFIMQLKDGAEKELLTDYLIETEFGTLTVNWRYKVTYKFRYRNIIENAQYTGFMAWDIPGGSAPETVTDLSKTVTVKMPEGYENCMLTYEYGGRMVPLGNFSSADIQIAPQVSVNYKDGGYSELVVYVEPDVNLVKDYIPSSGKTVTYNNTDQKIIAVGIDSGLFNKYLPQGTTSADSVKKTELILTSFYTNGAGELQSSVKDVGTYYATFSLILKVTMNNNATHDFLIAADMSKNVRVTVTPLEVNVTSGDSTAYIDENGKIVIKETAVTTDNALLSTTMFTPVFAPSDMFAVGHNDNGNYFTMKWNTGVNPDNFKIVRSYGDLDVSWRVKISFYLRPANADVFGREDYVNYTGLTFDRTGTAYRVKTLSGNTETVTVCEMTDNTLTVEKLKTLFPDAIKGYTVGSDYRYNNVSYTFEDGKAEIAPFISAYGEYGANEIRVYVSPAIPEAAMTAVGKLENYESAVSLPSTLADIKSISSRVYTKYVYIDEDGRTVDKAALEAGVEYTCYAYVITEVTAVTASDKTETNSYLAYFNAETVTK